MNRTSLVERSHDHRRCYYNCRTCVCLCGGNYALFTPWTGTSPRRPPRRPLTVSHHDTVPYLTLEGTRKKSGRRCCDADVAHWPDDHDHAMEQVGRRGIDHAVWTVNKQYIPHPNFGWRGTTQDIGYILSTLQMFHDGLLPVSELL